MGPVFCFFLSNMHFFFFCVFWSEELFWFSCWNLGDSKTLDDLLWWFCYFGIFDKKFLYHFLNCMNLTCVNIGIASLATQICWIYGRGNLSVFCFGLFNLINMLKYFGNESKSMKKLGVCTSFLSSLCASGMDAFCGIVLSLILLDCSLCLKVEAGSLIGYFLGDGWGLRKWKEEQA